MHKGRKVHTLRSLLSEVQLRGELPMRQCGMRIMFGCVLLLIGAMICGALLYRALIW